MKLFIGIIFLGMSFNALSIPQTPKLLSCNIEEQRALPGEIGGHITDTGEAHISKRANILTSDVIRFRKVRMLTKTQAKDLIHRIEKIRFQTDEHVRGQNFLSVAEKASLDQELDSIALQLCR